MAGIHKITSSLFIQSGSVAQFKNGITASLGLSSSGIITADQFVGIGEIPLELNVGKANDDGTFEEWETVINESIRITASGNFDTFMFIKNNTLTTVGDSSIWETVSIGDQNGLSKQSFINQTFDIPGVYEYFILATNNTLKKTSFKGTTITVT